MNVKRSRSESQTRGVGVPTHSYTACVGELGDSWLELGPLEDACRVHACMHACDLHGRKGDRGIIKFSTQLYIRPRKKGAAACTCVHLPDPSETRLRFADRVGRASGGAELQAARPQEHLRCT